MGFDVPADAYDRFMGRFSAPLAVAFAEFTDGDGPVLDVGCGPGALTRVLVDRFGADAVRAADPSASFVDAVRLRCPGVDVVQAGAESLPFADGRFAVVLAQLVVHFMSDPVAGLAEMARVTRSGGVLGACVWDFAGGRSPVSPFWRAVRELDPAAHDESARPGAGPGDLAALAHAAGWRDVHERTLHVRVELAGFDDWWEPVTLGVGPAGDYFAGLSGDRRAALRTRCMELVPAGPFALDAHAWAVRATR